MERIINLYHWEDQRRTFVWLIFITVFLSIIRIITFRIFILIIMGYRFFKGRNRYSKVYKRNYILVSWTLEYIIKQQFTEFFKEYEKSFRTG